MTRLIRALTGWIALVLVSAVAASVGLDADTGSVSLTAGAPSTTTTTAVTTTTTAPPAATTTLPEPTTTTAPEPIPATTTVPPVAPPTTAAPPPPPATTTTVFVAPARTASISPTSVSPNGKTFRLVVRGTGCTDPAGQGSGGHEAHATVPYPFNGPVGNYTGPFEAAARGPVSPSAIGHASSRCTRCGPATSPSGPRAWRVTESCSPTTR